MGSLKKEIELQMQQEETIGKFEEQIRALEVKKQELIKLAAQAEINGDEASYQLAEDNILYYQDSITILRQSKMNFDIIALTGDMTLVMNSAFAAMDKMASGGVKVPNYRKILKTRAKLGRYMKHAAHGQKMMRGMMKSSNPATRTSRTQEERDSVKAMVAAERAKQSGMATGGGIADAIAREKNSMPN